MVRDESILKQAPEDVIKSEAERSSRPHSEVIRSAGDQLNLKL